MIAAQIKVADPNRGDLRTENKSKFKKKNREIKKQLQNSASVKTPLKKKKKGSNKTTDKDQRLAHLSTLNMSADLAKTQFRHTCNATALTESLSTHSIFAGLRSRCAIPEKKKRCQEKTIQFNDASHLAKEFCIFFFFPEILQKKQQWTTQRLFPTLTMEKVEPRGDLPHHLACFCLAEVSAIADMLQ